LAQLAIYLTEAGTISSCGGGDKRRRPVPLPELGSGPGARAVGL